MIGLTIAMLFAPVAQDAGVRAMEARCRAVGRRLERTATISVNQLEAHRAREPQAIHDATFLRRVRDLQEAQKLARNIRKRYPGEAQRDAEVDRMRWPQVIAAAETCSYGIF